MTEQPNIFKFATSELSQDAFLCYLLSFGKKEYAGSEEYTAAKDFLHLCGIDEDVVDVKKQYGHIDVLIVTRNNCLIIEDKTCTCEHDNQICRYVEELKENKTYSSKIIKICYFKTSDYVYNYETSNSDILPQENCKSLRRTDILGILNKIKNKNLVIESYYNYLNSIEQKIYDCDNNDISTWFSEKWFNYLNDKLTGRNFDLSWVHNPSGGGYACYLDWIKISSNDQQIGEKYKQIEIHFNNEGKTSKVKLCFKYSSPSKEITQKQSDILEKLRAEIKDESYKIGRRIGQSTTYAYKYANSKEDIDKFIEAEK